MSDRAQVLIIGGGASGMAASVTAAARGREVVLLEGNDRVGKKLLVTGNGKCNFTNEILDPSCYHEAAGSFASSVIGKFSNRDLIDWFSDIGIESTVKDGRVYPGSEQASSVLDALRLQLEGTGVRVITGAKVMSIRKKQELFEVQTVQKTWSAETVILAAGSAAAPKTGSDGSGYRLAEQMGLTVREPLPALTSLHLKADYTKSWQGVRCDGSITLISDGSPVASSQGQLQLTSYGISGIPAFQVSRYASRSLAEGSKVSARICFGSGEKTAEETGKSLKARREKIGDYPAASFLNGVLPKNLAGVLLRLAGFGKGKYCRDLTDQELESLADIMTELVVPVTGTGGLVQAQVCTGGVVTDQIDPASMECFDIPGLYVTGELLDVDGICGGYNLHWAFATGRLAGFSV